MLGSSWFYCRASQLCLHFRTVSLIIYCIYKLSFSNLGRGVQYVKKNKHCVLSFLRFIVEVFRSAIKQTVYTRYCHRVWSEFQFDGLARTCLDTTWSESQSAVEVTQSRLGGPRTCDTDTISYCTVSDKCLTTTVLYGISGMNLISWIPI